MSAIVNGVLNSTIGLLCSKLRDYTAKRLNDGDLNDDQCRQIIVRELDDIKSKLDGLSRKDLLASLSFFKEGVVRLYASFETSGKCCDGTKGTSTSQTFVENESQFEGATAMISVKQAERDAIQRVSEISKLVGNLTITSQERYKSARESFKEAKKLATEAFNNTALSIEDRVMASRLRIASRILECLDDLEAAVRDCLLYLKELQDLPAVQAMVAVWYDSNKGIASRLRARLNKKKRNDNVESIQMFNELLKDLTVNFTNIRMGFFNWPTIRIGNAVYHSLLQDNVVLTETKKVDMQVPWLWEFPGYTSSDVFALTSKEEILSRSAENLYIITRNGRRKLFCSIPPENDGDIVNAIRCFAVDEINNVYIVFEISYDLENVPTKYKLLTVDANGIVKADRFIDIIENRCIRPRMSVSKDGRIVICDRWETMYICDSTNNSQDYRFPLPYKNVKPNDIRCFSFTVSNKNEIISTFTTYKRHVYMYIITMNGELKRAVQVPLTNSAMDEPIPTVVFNHVNETILVSLANACLYATASDDESNPEFLPPYNTLYSYSNTGELIQQFNILGWYPWLISHSKGLIALVSHNQVIILQT